MAQGSGIRPWKRGTEAARAVLNAVLPNGDLIVTDEGHIYAGDGSTTIKALKRLLRMGDPGVAEEIGSEEYLKATKSPAGKVFEDAIGMDGAVPSWIITRWRARMGLAYSAVTEVHTIHVAGQSNATQVEVYPASPREAHPRVWQYFDGALRQLPGWVVYLGAETARAYADANPHVLVVVVDHAVGSTGFTSTSLSSPPVPATAGWPAYHTVSGGTWDRTLTTDPKNLYSLMVSRRTTVDAAILNMFGMTPKIAALLWAQGEDDTTAGANLTTAQYGAALDDLIATARTDFGSSTMPVVVYSMTLDYVYEYPAPTNRWRVNNALNDTPKRVQRTSYEHGPWGYARRNDIIHLSPAGHAIRGKRFMDALYRARLNLPTTRALPPTGLKVTRSGNTVRASWDAPMSRATAYTAQWSSDDSTWTTLTLDAALSQEVSFTATAGTVVIMRLSATSEEGTSQYSQKVYA